MTTKDNFHLMTKGTFSKCDLPNTAPDYVSLNKQGNVSSKYWYTNDGVIRQSDHWGRVASCIWTLKGYSTQIRDCEVSNVDLVGYVSFTDLDSSTNKFQNIVDKQNKVIMLEIKRLQDENSLFVSYRDGMATEKGLQSAVQFDLDVKQLFNL
jgi:hypothetical protein